MTVGEYTDLMNAKLLVQRHGSDLICVGGKTWYVWDGRRFGRDDTGEVVRRAKDTAQVMLRLAILEPDTAKQKAMIRHSLASQDAPKLLRMVALAATEPEVAARESELDADPMLLNVQNGTLDLRAFPFKLRPHDRTDRITKIAAATFDPEAASWFWHGFFLETIFPDPDVRRFVQTAVGYSLTGTPTEDVLFFLYGPPRSGKTTFLEALRHALGEYAGDARFELFLEHRNDGGAGAASPELMALEGKRLVTAVEAKKGRRLNEAAVMWMTGQDTIVGRRLYHEQTSFRPQHTFWLAANDAPIARDDVDAVWTRIRRLPTGPTIPEKDRDPAVRSVLLHPGNYESVILTWALVGLKRYLEERLVVPKAVEESAKQWRADMDPLADWLEERCVIDPSAHATFATLWGDYDWWANAGSQENRVKSKKAMALRLAKDGRFEQKKDHHVGVSYLGLRVRGTDGTDGAVLSGISPQGISHVENTDITVSSVPSVPDDGAAGKAERIIRVEAIEVAEREEFADIMRRWMNMDDAEKQAALDAKKEEREALEAAESMEDPKAALDAKLAKEGRQAERQALEDSEDAHYDPSAPSRTPKQ